MQSYLNLLSPWQGQVHGNMTNAEAEDPSSFRRLQSSVSNDDDFQSNRNNNKKRPPPHYDGPQLVIAGKLMVEGAPCNIAQYNMLTDQWSLSERIQLSLYNSYSGGCLLYTSPSPRD